MMWILLLTLSTGKGVAIDHVQFQSEVACEQAAVIWVNQNKSTFRDTIAICVKGE